MLIILLSFPIPIFIAVLLGWRAGRTDPQSAGEFVRAGLFYCTWALMLIFMWHGLWIVTLVPAHWQDTARSATNWTIGTGAIWLPVYGITYVWKALRTRKAG